MPTWLFMYALANINTVPILSIKLFELALSTWIMQLIF